MAPGWNRDHRVTAAEASRQFGDVSIHLIAWWRNEGKLVPAGRRGRSLVYRWGDLIDVERATRLNRRSSRNEDRDRPEPAACAA